MDLKSINLENQRVAYLIRHGQYEDETNKITEKGKNDIAKSALKILKDINSMNYEGLINIYSSPQNRAVESAQTIHTIYNKFLRLEDVSTEGLEAELSIDDRLDCDALKLNNVLLNENYNIGLFVTHMQDIEYVTSRIIKTSDYIMKVLDKN